MKRLKFINTNNTRDIGGIINKRGQLIKENQIIRSDLPGFLDDSEKSFLLKNKINTIIDLRKPADIRNNPNTLNSSEFNYFNIPIGGDKVPELENEIPTGYINIIEDIDSMQKVLAIIAEAQNGIFLNCSAGKDRTGVVSMLLLLLAEADESDILIDYQISFTLLRSEIRNMHFMYPGMPSFVGQSKMEYMEETLKLFKKRFQSIENYMAYINIDKSKIMMIKQKLVGCGS